MMVTWVIFIQMCVLFSRNLWFPPSVVAFVAVRSNHLTMTGLQNIIYTLYSVQEGLKERSEIRTWQLYLAS